MNALIVAFIGASVVCLATIIYQSQTVAGPPLWMLALLRGVATGVALALENDSPIWPHPRGFQASGVLRPRAVAVSR